MKQEKKKKDFKQLLFNCGDLPLLGLECGRPPAFMPLPFYNKIIRIT